MLRTVSRHLKRTIHTNPDFITATAPTTMSRKSIEQIPPPLHRGMTQLDRKAFVTQFTRLGVRVDRKDVTRVTKAREMQE